MENSRKGAVVAHMLYTALRNGKDADVSSMTDLADRLKIVERKMLKLAIAGCNGDPSYSEEEWKKNEDFVLNIIEEKIGCKCYCNADPRGAIIRLYLIDEDGDAWYNQAETQTTVLAWD